MRITTDKDPSLRIDDGRPIPIQSAEVVRDVECSYLRDILDRDGNVLPLPVGAHVALFEGLSEVFVGIAQTDGSVLDLLSSQSISGEDGNYVDF